MKGHPLQINNVAFRKGIRDDGTVEGYAVETYYLPCKAVGYDDAGFLRVLIDDNVTDVETRIHHDALVAAGWVKAQEVTGDGSGEAMPPVSQEERVFPGVKPTPEPVGVITSMVKGGVTWRTWPDQLADGTRLYAESPAPEGDWLWRELMGFCKKRGFPPAAFDDLFAIVGRARAAATPTEAA
jgi:hypothetical protein